MITAEDDTINPTRELGERLFEVEKMLTAEGLHHLLLGENHGTNTDSSFSITGYIQTELSDTARTKLKKMPEKQGSAKIYLEEFHLGRDFQTRFSLD